MKLSAKIVAPIVIVVFAGGIGISAALNLWQTESTKEPIKYTTGEFEGEYNPADIRGSYTFADIANSFDVTAEALAAAFDLDGEPDALKAKDLEEAYGEVDGGEIGTDSIRYFVALYTGLPYIPEEDTMLPATSIQVLSGKVSEETLAEARARSISMSQFRTPDQLPEEHSEDSTEAIVKGKTTFADLKSWGLSEEEVESAIGMAVGKSGVTVRDHVTAAGKEFSAAKTALQELIDSKPR